jgi:hypothetical protein
MGSTTIQPQKEESITQIPRRAAAIEATEKRRELYETNSYKQKLVDHNPGDQRGECAILYVRFIFETLNCTYKWTVDYHVTFDVVQDGVGL